MEKVHVNSSEIDNFVQIVFGISLLTPDDLGTRIDAAKIPPEYANLIDTLDMRHGDKAVVNTALLNAYRAGGDHIYN